MTALLCCACLLSTSTAYGDVSEFELLNGIHVISRTVPEGEVEGVSMFLIGGSRFLTKDNQGIEAFALETAMTGSRDFPAARWREIMDLTLAQWTASYNYDCSRYHLKCLSEDLPLLLEGFADCLMNPEMDSSSVNRIQSTMLASVQADLAEPDNLIWLVSNRGFMGDGHPYMLRPEGYPHTLEGFTADDAIDWLDRRMVSGNILITHAGPTAPELLEEMLNETFGLIPQGAETLPEVPEFAITRDTLVTEYDETLSAYSVVKFNAPPPGHPDMAAFTTACSVLDERLWQVLRTDHGLTYATYAGATDNYRRNWGYMYVSTAEPVQAALLMSEVFRGVAAGDVDQSLVTGVANNHRTLQGIRAQSMDTQCWMLGTGYISTGDWQTFYRLNDSFRLMTPEMTSNALATWAGPAGWGIIADSSLVDFSTLESWSLEGD